jgi:TATA-box binding protein (TBP) (component of TFIID and TFIIIB)
MELEYVVPTLDVTPLRISTITTTAQLGVKINLANLFEQIKIIKYWDLTDGILKMNFCGTSKGESFKDIMMKSKKSTTSFFNQATLVVRREITPLNWKEVNIKLFRNGGVQITGVKSIEMASESIKWLINHIVSTYTDSEHPIFDGIPNLHKEQIQLVNTDFSIGCKVRRDVLHQLLIDKYKLNSNYESAIYQGVKTKYFFNKMRPEGSLMGVCPCEKLCKGTGDGMSIGACKKITISPFQTGQVIITGARTMEQIYEAYEFIKSVFRDNADQVLRKQYILPPTEETEEPEKKPKKKILTGWIQHPCPRNVIKLTEPNATETAAK